MIKMKNIQELLEAHLDKIVLGLIGVISLYLLWALIVSNPYGAVVNGRKFGPGQIDLHNRQQAQMLADSLNDPIDPIIYDQKIAAEFEAALQCTLPELAVGLAVPYPGIGSQVFDENRVYPIPEIIPLSEVQVASLRGAVHKPTAEIGPDTPYSSVPTELGDLDLITVSGRIDIQTLYRNFQQSFMGPRLSAAWREPAFAKPVFARIELQRRQQLSDGTWNDDWEVVPRTQIDSFRKLIEQTPMTTEQMEFGGVMMWTKQYEDPRVQVDLLQPVAYDFASIQTAWLPPKYLDEAQAIIKKQADELRRTTREERLRARDANTGGTMMDMLDGAGGAGGAGGRTPAQTRPTARPKPQPRTPARTPTPQRGGRDNTAPGGGMMGLDPAATPARTAAAAARRERTLEDIQKDMEKDSITEETKLESQRDPLLVWVHDDTTQPGSTYQYRIRVGVFNPIAGRDWFSENQKQFKNQVVLWSTFSEPTKEVYVPKMMHLFPTEILAKEAAGGVKIDVAKYSLGQWHTHEFEIFPGQIVGQAIEVTPKTSAANPAMGMGMGMDMMLDSAMGAVGGVAAAPREVDFATPYMLVDINSRVDWGTTFNRTEYSQILYCGSEQTLLALAIGKANWPGEMRREYSEIKDAEENALPLNMYRTTTPGMRQQDTGRPGQPLPGMMLDMM